MGPDSSEPISSQQGPELVTRDEQGNVTYHLSDSPPTRSDTKPLANPPGYDDIIEDGFPVQTLHTAGTYYSGTGIHTLVGDVNCDGFQEIVVTGIALGPLYMFDYQGNLVPGWPQPLEGAAYPVMQEGLVIAGYSASDNITAYNQAGSVLWQRVAAIGVISPPSIGYVYSQATEGVFLGEFELFVHGYRVADGIPLPGWPVPTDGGQYELAPAIADIDDDGENEIIARSPNTSSGVIITVFNEDGSMVSGWPVQVSGSGSLPVIGDVDGDGTKELIVLSYDHVNVYSPFGILKRTWQHSGTEWTNPALADINGDGIPEIIVQDRLLGEITIDVADGFGNPMPGWPLSVGVGSLGSSAPIVGDVDGDGLMEIVFTTHVSGSGTTGYVHVVNDDGTYVANFPMPLLIGMGAVPAIADIDLDNHNEIVITGQYWDGQSGNYDKVWVFDLDRDNPSAQHGGIEWGQFRGNMRHTNEYKDKEKKYFCVSNATELQDALIEAQFNEADDIIRVAQGTYNGYFVYESSEGDSITMRGGYTAGCKRRELNPTNTILNGGDVGRVLEVTSSAGGDITVDGFTIQHGGNVPNGGGVFAQSSTASGTAGTVTIANNIITENSVTANGGGVYAVSESTSGTAGTVTIINNIIFGNSAPNLYAGGVYAESYAPSGTAGTVSLTNNTITENNAQNGGGVFLGIGNTGGAIAAYNNIIWGNTATASGDDIYLNKGSGTADSYNNNYSDMDGDTWDSESGKITADPLFVGGGDYHLQPTSSCLDTGTNSAPDLPSTDFEGDPRIMDGNRDGDAVVDIGADERHRLWYVDGDQGASGDGTSWPEAFKTIGEALGTASDGDEIWVKQGIYPLAAQLTVDKAVHMYGGFASTETARNQRDWVTNVTMVDGQNADYRCLYIASDVTIDGFTITNGNAGSENGGGLYISYASPLITNCTFSGNYARRGGGLGCNDYSSPIITNCTFSGNDGDYAGGIYVFSSYPKITNCTFSENTAQVDGGAIINARSIPKITNCTFSGNTANGDLSTSGGGAIDNYYSSPTITNCSFTGNTAHSNGGGIYNQFYSYSIITNCTFYNNSAGTYGGAVANKVSDPTFTNCILWGNTAGTSGKEIYVFSGSPTFTYCDIEGGYTGTSNIANDPLFVDASYPDPANWDLHLQENSPCIDHGSASALQLPTTDFEGDARIMGNAPDMGADETPYYGIPDSVTAQKTSVLCPSGLGFGEVQVDDTLSLDLIMNNTTDSDIDVGPVSTPAGSFSKPSDNCDSITLHPGDTCSITIQFAPSSTGTFYDSFDITTDDPEAGTVTVSLSGIGVSNGESAFPQGSHPAGPEPGLPDHTGPSRGRVTGDSASREASSEAVVATTNTDTASGAAPESLSVDTGTTNSSASPLVFSSLPPDSLKEPEKQLLLAQELEPYDVMVFGEVKVGASDQLRITFSHEQGAAIHMGDITLPSAPYWIVENTCSGTELGAGGECAVTVQFAPPTAEGFYDYFLMPTDDPEVGTLRINLEGRGRPE
jgi:parallel beta-helix repeat protein